MHHLSASQLKRALEIKVRVTCFVYAPENQDDLLKMPIIFGDKSKLDRLKWRLLEKNAESEYTIFPAAAIALRVQINSEFPRYANGMDRQSDFHNLEFVPNNPLGIANIFWSTQDDRQLVYSPMWRPSHFVVLIDVGE